MNKIHKINKKSPQIATLNSKNLLSIEGMNKLEINSLLDRADYFADLDPLKIIKTLNGYVILNVFFENSTRTRVSFELAGRRLGAEVINISVDKSSIKKGESLLDTANTLSAMKPNLLIVRHPESGAPKLFSDYLNCSIVNAGDGRHEHPTQALLDALTIRRRLGRIEGLKIAICGDILNSRVARSNIHLLTTLGVEVRCIAPPTLMPKSLENLGVNCFNSLKDGINNVNAIMLLRLQNERMSGTESPSKREYYRFYGLDEEKLRMAHHDAVIMHPGPMNRGVEIASSLADNEDRSLIKTQVEIGVAIRMATIEAVYNAQKQ